MVIEFPFIEAIPAGLPVSETVTGKPEVAVALMLKGAVVNCLSGMLSNVIAWLAFPTVNVVLSTPV